jgi:hypothetical protein
MAQHTRSLRDPRLRVNAPANSGLHGDRLLQRVAPPFPRFCLTGSGFRKRRALRVARPRLLCSRAKSSGYSDDCRGSILGTVPPLSRANAATPRNRKIHCARRREFRVRSTSPHRRIKHCPRFDTTIRFPRIDRFSSGPANPLAIRSQACSKIQRRDLQLCTHRPRRACLCCAPTQMRHLSREDILPCEKSTNSAG